MSNQAHPRSKPNSNSRSQSKHAKAGRSRLNHRATEARRLQSTMGEVKRDIRELGDAARGTAEEKLAQLRDQAGDYVEQGKAKLQEMEQQFETRLREKPIKSILTACGIGFVLGFLMRR